MNKENIPVNAYHLECPNCGTGIDLIPSDGTVIKGTENDIYEAFRNFIRAEHLSVKWNEYLAANPIQSSPHPESVEEAKWQLCPKCNGTGEIYINELYKNQTTGRVGYITCDVCGGAKTLATPSSNSAEVEKLRKKHDQIREIWLNTDKSITKLKDAIQQYVSDKGDDYETFEAEYLD